MTDSPVFGATHTSTLLARIDLAGAEEDTAAPGSRARNEAEGYWLAPSFGAASFDAASMELSPAATAPAMPHRSSSRSSVRDSLSQAGRASRPAAPFDNVAHVSDKEVHTARHTRRRSDRREKTSKHPRGALNLLSRLEAVVALTSTMVCYAAKEGVFFSPAPTGTDKTTEAWRLPAQAVYCVVLCGVSALLLARAWGSRSRSSSRTRASFSVYLSAALVALVALVALRDLGSLLEQHHPDGSVVALTALARDYLRRAPEHLVALAQSAVQWGRAHSEAVLLGAALIVFIRAAAGGGGRGSARADLAA